MKSIFNDLIQHKIPHVELVKHGLRQIMDGKATQTQIGAFIMGISALPLNADILAACASVMKEKAYSISTTHSTSMDTCGTGGDSLGTFNISTTVAFVIAGCGVPVAKHGNRSISSKSGSADVLAALGLDLERSPEKVAACFNEIGISFFFAPLFHSSMKYVAQARTEIGIPTIFNLLGPLANPLHLTHQLVGVYREEIAELYCNTLKKLGLRRGAVVSGGGMDEVSTLNDSRMFMFDEVHRTTQVIHPEDFDIPKTDLEALQGGAAQENASILTNILQGKGTQAQQDIVVLNAGVCLFVAEKANTIPQGIKLAQQTIESGEAYKKLIDLIQYK